MTLSALFLLIILIFFSAFCSSSETALFSLSPFKVKSFAQSTDAKKKQVAKLLASSRDLLITLIMINVVMNILIQNVVSSLFGNFSEWILSVGVPLSMTLIFGEVIPKSIGMANQERLSCLVAYPLSGLQKIFFPLRKILIYISSAICWTAFLFFRREKEVSVEELEHALQTSTKYGVLSEDEAQLMRGYLHLKHATVKEFMRPREEMLFFDIEDPLSKLLHLFVEQECTRIPVCEGSLDQMIGIISSGIFFLNQAQIKSGQDLKSFLTKPFFAPETLSAHHLLDQLYEKKESLALVVDEYGSLAGLIAFEDLVETVIGKIADRRDEKSRYTRSGDVIIASGKLELVEIEELFGVELKSAHHMKTVGGFLTEKWGDIPKSGTKWVEKELLFQVLSSDEKRVRRVYIRHLKPRVKK